MIRRLAPIAALCSVFVLFAAPAFAAAPTASFITDSPKGLGWTNIFDPTGAGTPTVQASGYRFTIEGQNVLAYCIDRTKTLNGDAAFTVTTATQPWAAKAAALAANHASIGTPAADPRDEGAAVQIAIWTLTNGDTISEGTVPFEEIRPRAAELAAAAVSLDVPTSVDPTITVTAEKAGAATLAVAKVTGAPAGTPVEFSLNSTSQVVTTDASGKASYALPGFGTVTARATVTVGAGALLVPNDGTQPLITASAFTLTREAYASSQGPVTPPPPTTPPAPATPEPPAAAPTTTESTGTLPYTGTSRSPWLLVTGFGLVALAGVFGWRWRTSATR